jgi:hypothetical protein
VKRESVAVHAPSRPAALAARVSGTRGELKEKSDPGGIEYVFTLTYPEQ